MIRSRIPDPHQQLDAHFGLCCTLPAAADGGPALYTELETVPVQPQHLCASILLGNVRILRVAGFAKVYLREHQFIAWITISPSVTIQLSASSLSRQSLSLSRSSRF